MFLFEFNNLPKHIYFSGGRIVIFPLKKERKKEKVSITTKTRIKFWLVVLKWLPVAALLYLYLSNTRIDSSPAIDTLSYARADIIFSFGPHLQVSVTRIERDRVAPIVKFVQGNLYMTSWRLEESTEIGTPDNLGSSRKTRWREWREREKERDRRDR